MLWGPRVEAEQSLYFVESACVVITWVIASQVLTVEYELCSASARGRGCTSVFALLADSARWSLPECMI